MKNVRFYPFSDSFRTVVVINARASQCVFCLETEHVVSFCPHYISHTIVEKDKPVSGKHELFQCGDV